MKGRKVLGDNLPKPTGIGWIGKDRAAAPPATTPEAAEKPEGERIVRYTIGLPSASLERLRDAAWWERRTVASIVVEALSDWFSRMEGVNGKPYEPRRAPVNRGRPVR